MKKGKRIRFYIIILFSFWTIIFSSCSNVNHSYIDSQEPAISLEKEVDVTESETRTNVKAVTIRFLCTEPYERYTELAQRFHQIHPGILIQIVRSEDVFSPSKADYTLVERLERSVMVADVSIMGGIITRTGTRGGLVYDLSTFIKNDSGFDLGDFYPGTIEAFRWDGGTWGVPAQVNLKLLFYDKKAFDEVGVPYPNHAWNQNKFLSTMQQLVIRKEDGELERFSFANSDVAFVHAIIEGMASTHNQTYNELDMPALDTPEVIEAMTWYVDLARVHGLMPAQSVIPQADIRDGRMRMTWQEDWLKSRRVAMWPDSISSYWYYFDSPWLDFEIGDIGIVPLPFGEQGTAYHLPWGYIMSAGTSYPKESWLWIKYLSRQQVPNGLHILPARRSVAQDADYWAQWQEEEQKIIEHSLSHLIKTHPESLVATELLKAVEAVFEGKTVEEALEAAQANALATYTVLAEMEPVEVLVTADDTEDNDALIVEFASRNYDPTHSFREVAEVFNAEHSTVQVKITEAGARPDCFADSIALLNDAEGAMPRNLQPYVDVESSSLHDQFYFIDAFRRAGNLYGLPSLAQPQVLFYDQSLFDAAGLPYPQADWTPQDFRAAARRLTLSQGGIVQYGFLPLSDAMIDLPLFMAMQNVRLWDGHGHPRFDAPEVVEAVSWYATLIRESMPPFAATQGDSSGEQRRNLINNGQSGMWSVYLVPGLASGIMPEASNTIRMAPFPGNQVRLNYEGLFISSETAPKKAEACWQWMKYAVSHRSVTPAMGIPASREALASDAFAAQAGPSVVETYRKLVQHDALGVPNALSAQPQLEALREALEEILQGTPPEHALSEAQRKASQ